MGPLKAKRCIQANVSSPKSAADAVASRQLPAGGQGVEQTQRVEAVVE
jgi:hypothetical protein